MTSLTGTRNPALLHGNLWRHADFLRLWLGETISLFGDQITLIALPTIAILLLHATAFQVGVLVACSRITSSVVALVAGVYVDRLPRRMVMIVTDLGRLLTLATIPVAFLCGWLTLTQLYGGGLVVFFDVAYAAYLPSLIERENLIEGNARLAVSDSLATIVGPGLAGLLIQVFGAPLAVVADALSFLASIVGITSIRTQETETTQDGHRWTLRHLLGELREGLRVTFGHPALGRLSMSIALSNAGMVLGKTIFLLFAYRTLHLQPGIVGLILASGGVTALLGAMVAATLGKRLGIIPTLALSRIIDGGSLLLVPLALLAPMSAVPILFLAWMVSGFAGPIWTVNSSSLRQRVTPDALQGRVAATIRTVAFSGSAIGALISGLIAALAITLAGQINGLGLAVAVGGALAASSAFWVTRTPLDEERELRALRMHI